MDRRDQSRSTSSLATLYAAYRWPLSAFLVFLLAGLLFITWLVSHGSRGEVDLANSAPPGTASPNGAVKKPSPLGASDTKKAEDDRGLVTPPMALPPASDLSGARAMQTLPGNAQLDLGPGGASQRVPSPNTPWPALGERFRAKHKKGLGGCSGELLLGADRLVFTCADNPGRNLVILLAQVTSVDDDGIAASGEKFHFDIPALAGKRQVHDLFAEWLARTRLTQPSR